MCAVGERGPIEAPCHRRFQVGASKPLILPKCFQVFPAGELGIERQILRNPSQSHARPSRIRPVAENRHRTRIRNNAPHDAANQRALAGAIGAKQSQAFPALQFKRNALDRGQRAKAFDQSLHAQGEQRRWNRDSRSHSSSGAK
jgi:hypothetical protein